MRQLWLLQSVRCSPTPEQRTRPLWGRGPLARATTGSSSYPLGPRAFGPHCGTTTGSSSYQARCTAVRCRMSDFRKCPDCTKQCTATSPMMRVNKTRPSGLWNPGWISRYKPRRTKWRVYARGVQPCAINASTTVMACPRTNFQAVDRILKSKFAVRNS